MSDGVTEPIADDVADQVDLLVERAFGLSGPRVTALTDVNGGRGAFSIVVRADLEWSEGITGPDRPGSVVAKLPIPGPNGAAAAASGAYRRESLAYRQILPATPVAHPRPWAVHDDGDTCSLLLQDLGDHRSVDQLDGLGADDAVAVAAALAGLHRTWAGANDRLGGVRHNTVAGLSPAGLDAGLQTLETRWGDEIGPAERSVFAQLRAAHGALAERFDDQPATLCHGDPRADNLAFDDGTSNARASDANATDGGPLGHRGTPVLFDWQQMAVQFGEADLAWLAATSLTTETRRATERQLVAAGDGHFDRYRLGLALPGLAVLFLAQRELPNGRARRFVATSLRRIAAAVADNETASLVSHR